MPNIESIIEKALSPILNRALAQAQAMFLTAFEEGSTFGTRLQVKIERGLRRFLDEGIQWDNMKPGLKE